jgi:ABC-type iron transport system FetAB permease component
MLAMSVFHAWTRLWFQAIEVQQVIWLRTMKLMAGGAMAEREAVRMVAEKIEAAQETGRRLALGASPKRAVRHYRSRVRANRRRLLR